MGVELRIARTKTTSSSSVGAREVSSPPGGGAACVGGADFLHRLEREGGLGSSEGEDTFGNPIAMTITRNVAFHAVTDADRRKLFGILQTFAAIGVSAGIIALTLFQSVNFTPFFYIFEIGALMLLTVRFFSLDCEISKYENTQKRT